MEIPKRTKNKIQKKLLLCAYHDCNKEFYGSRSRKYCDFHTNPLNRERIKINYKEKILENNIIINEKRDSKSEIIELTCSLKGCKNTYRIIRTTRIGIYPKYCEEHRSSYKRDWFIKNKIKEIN